MMRDVRCGDASTPVRKSAMAETTDALTPRVFRTGDDEALLVLLTAAFGLWPTHEVPVAPIDHLRWKLRRDAVPPVAHAVVELNAHLIAANLTVVHRFKARNRVLNIFDSVDVCVHPDYRNRGLYRRLRAFVNTETIGPTMDLEVSAGRVPAVARVADTYARRWPLGHVVQVLVRPLRFWPQRTGGTRARHRRLALAAAYLGVIGIELVRGVPRRAIGPGGPLTRTSRFDERIDAFFEEAATAFEFIGLRRMDYLNWRYGDIRAGEFGITLAEEHGRILGFSVLRLSHGRAYLADLLALPGRLDVVTSLLVHAIQHARAGGAASIACWLPTHHPYRALLRRHGFFRRRNAAVYFEPTGAPDEAVAFLHNPLAAIHFVLGDTDLV